MSNHGRDSPSESEVNQILAEYLERMDAGEDCEIALDTAKHGSNAEIVSEFLENDHFLRVMILQIKKQW